MDKRPCFPLLSSTISPCKSSARVLWIRCGRSICRLCVAIVGGAWTLVSCAVCVICSNEKHLMSSPSPSAPKTKTPKRSYKEVLTQKAQSATEALLSRGVEGDIAYDFEPSTAKKSAIPPCLRRAIRCTKKPNSDECSGVFGPYSSLFIFSFAVGLVFGPLDLNAIYIISWFLLIELAYFLIYGYTEPETPTIRGVTFLCYLLGFIIGRTFTVYANDVLESRETTRISESQIYVTLDDVQFTESILRNANVAVSGFDVLSQRLNHWWLKTD